MNQLLSKRKVVKTKTFWIGNLVHTIALLCFVIWLIGITAYQVPDTFHFFLLIAVVMALLRFVMEKSSPKLKDT